MTRRRCCSSSHGTVDDLDDLAAFVDEHAPRAARRPGARRRAAPPLRGHRRQSPLNAINARVARAS